ncbi:MAG: LPS-assembly protein LptD, partial [Deltaproteobacteria bacterium]|nr:LPS-assembly protein LptD [Deltaproteobacteria bacterium]
MRYKVVVTLLKILLVAFTVPHLALAKQKPFIPGFSTAEKVNIKADKMYYEQKTNLFFAEGNVVIQQEDATLKADKVTINTVTQDAKAIGNVTLTEGENVLNCERLDVNLATKVGTISQATLFVKEKNYHISGQSFEKLGENRYRVLNGTVTTCDGEVPAWKITGGEIDVTLEGVATLKKSTFQIKNIPIAYFPYFFYPVKIERQSGFLMPHFAYSSRDGVKFENSFFWAISDNADATFYIDYASEKGVGEGVEFRYVLNERSKGTLYQYYIEERSKYFKDEYDPVLGRKRKRGIVSFEGEHYFNDTSYTKARMAWLSDRKIFNDYSREIRRFESEWNRTSLRSLEKNKSLLFYTKNWSQYTLTTELNYYKDLVKKDRTTLQKLPQINFSGKSQNITRTPLFFKIDSAYGNFTRNHGVEGQRLDLFPKISWPFNFANYLKFTPEIGMRGLFALNLSNTDSNFDYQKAVIDANAELSTTLLKVYHFPGKKISKLKHSIEPNIIYRYNSDE